MAGVIIHVYIAYIYLYLSWLNIHQQYGIISLGEYCFVEPACTVLVVCVALPCMDAVTQGGRQAFQVSRPQVDRDKAILPSLPAWVRGSPTTAGFHRSPINHPYASYMIQISQDHYSSKVPIWIFTLNCAPALPGTRPSSPDRLFQPNSVLWRELSLHPELWSLPAPYFFSEKWKDTLLWLQWRMRL